MKQTITIALALFFFGGFAAFSQENYLLVQGGVGFNSFLSPFENYNKVGSSAIVTFHHYNSSESGQFLSGNVGYFKLTSTANTGAGIAAIPLLFGFGGKTSGKVQFMYSVDAGVSLLMENLSKDVAYGRVTASTSAGFLYPLTNSFGLNGSIRLIGLFDGFTTGRTLMPVTVGIHAKL